MATIAALTEDWDGGSLGAAVSTSNSGAEALTGTGTAVISDDYTYDTERGARFDTSGNFRIARFEHAAAYGWRGFALAFGSVPAANVAIARTMNASSQQGCDVRLNSDGRLALRDAGGGTRWTSSIVLSPLTVYWISVRTNTTNHRVRIYNGVTGALLDDSMAQTHANFSRTDLVSFSVGILANSTLTVWIGKIRGDDADEIPPPVASEAADLVYTRSRVELIDASTSVGEVTVVQDSGTTATITEPSPNVFHITHPALIEVDMVFTVTATGEAEDEEDDEFTIPAGDSGVDVRPYRVWTDGEWK